MPEAPRFQELAPSLQAIALATLAVGPAGGCVHGHGGSVRLRFAGNVAQLLVFEHGRAPWKPGDRLQVYDVLELGTVTDVIAVGDVAICEQVIAWLRDTVHQKRDRGLGWIPCQAPVMRAEAQYGSGAADLQIGCDQETQREDGVCWQHSEETSRELEFGQNERTLPDRKRDPLL